MRSIDVLMSNDTLSDVPSLLHGWSFRDKIDKFYLRGKDDLGFDQYQVRDDKPIRRHWYMVFLMYTFVIWHRQCGSFRKFSRKVCENHPSTPHGIKEDSLPQQVKIGTTIHMTFNEFEPIYLSFSLPVTPW